MAKKKLKDRSEKELHELQNRVNRILREKGKKRHIKLTLSDDHNHNDDDDGHSHGRCGGRCGHSHGRCGGRCG